MKNLLCLIVAAILLTACGGGGGNSPSGSSALSVTQRNFESATIKDTYVNFDWNVPTTNIAPTNGTDFFYAVSNSALSSPTSSPVLNVEMVTNLTSGMALPILVQRGVRRVLKNGVVYVSNARSIQIWSYSDSNVILTTYASDKQTPLFASVYDTWSEAAPLSGQIANATIIKSFLGFARLSEPLNFEFTKNWLIGASYFTRKGFLQADTLFVFDWTGKTFDTNVTAYAGVETTIETFFANSAIVTVGGWTIDGMSYNLMDGAIRQIQGARVWIAGNIRPTSASPTDAQLALIEWSGKLYVGELQKVGTRFRSIDGIDTTIVNDYQIRLNRIAAESIKQTIKF